LEKSIIFSTKSCASVYQILYQKSQECQWANESRDQHFPLLKNAQISFYIFNKSHIVVLYRIKQWQYRDRRKYQEKQRIEAIEIEFGTIV